MKKSVGENKGSSVLRSISVGVLSCSAVSILGAAGAASLVINERMQESSMRYFSLAILLLATFLGGLIAAKLAGQKRALVSGIVALIYSLLLVGITILFFEGAFVNVLMSMLAVALGFAASCLLCVSTGGKKLRRKRASW